MTTATVVSMPAPYIEREGVDNQIEQIKRESDAKVRLPLDLINAMAEAVAIETHPAANHEIRTTADRTDEQEKINQRIKDIADEYLAAASDFMQTDDTEPDNANGGQVLKIDIDVSKSPVGSNLNAIATNAIKGKIGWMGYELDAPNPDEPHKVTMTVRGYNR